jgi:spermidine synthase
MNIPFVLAFILMGFTFTITQVMVIRELLVIFMGNELSTAIILANWLLLEAAGSFLLGKRANELGLGRRGYAFLQMLVSVLLPLTIYGIRSLRDIMGLATGEGASLVAIFSWTAPLLAPLGVVDGIMFAVGCRLHSDRAQKGASSVGKVYLLEAVGAGGGGALYTFFFIPFFTSFQVAFFLAAANLISALLLISGEEEKDTWKNKALTGSLWGVLLANVLFLILPGAQGLEKSSTARQWRGLQVLDSRWSPYGNVTVGRREEQLTFFANGMPVCNAPVPDIARVEEMVHYPLLLIPSPRRVLIIGGGFGGVIGEVLKHPVDEVDYTEIDPLIIRMIQENLTPLTRPEIENPRLRIHNLDGRLFIKTTPEKFDGIILNLPHPSTLELNRYYTVEFFNEIYQSLNGEGVLSISIPGSETYLSPELRDLNLCLIRSLREVFPSVHVIPGEVNCILASAAQDSGPLLPELFIRRLRDRKIATRFLTEFQIRLKLEAQRRNWLEGSLRRGEAVKLNRDANPSGLYYGIAYWNAQFHPFVQTLWGKGKGLHLWHLALLLSLLTCGALPWRRKSEEEGARGVLICLVATTGFFGIAFNVLLIFSFQTLYGYAYHWIGLLIAAFMTGLALGSWTMTRSLEKIQKFFLTLVGVEILMVLFATLGIILLTLLYSPAWGQKILSGMRSAFLVLSGLSGYLVGLEFPLSSNIFSGRGEGVTRTAGILYAADLFGAWAGSLLVGVLFIPVLGILRTCAVILFLKLASLGLVVIMHRPLERQEKKRPGDPATAR